MAIDDVPVFIALKKAKDVQSYFPDRRILAADTIVVLGERIIEKPKDRANAIEILTMLSGTTHRVITGVVLLDGEKEIRFSDTTDVEFHPVSTNDITYYVDVYNPYDKAGAYAIQEWIGAIAIKKVSGCFYNVMGLPISRVVRCLMHDES